MWQYVPFDTLIHYGKGHLDGGKSGRYPWGSGKKNKDRNKPPTYKEMARNMDDDRLAARVKRLNQEKQYIKISKDLYGDDEPSGLEKTKGAVDSLGNSVKNIKRQLDDDTRRQPKKVEVDLSKMSDQELRDKINRAALEQQYVNYYGKREVSKGRERVSQVLDYAGGILALGGSALAIAVSIQALKNG